MSVVTPYEAPVVLLPPVGGGGGGGWVVVVPTVIETLFGEPSASTEAFAVSMLTPHEPDAGAPTEIETDASDGENVYWPFAGAGNPFQLHPVPVMWTPTATLLAGAAVALMLTVAVVPAAVVDGAALAGRARPKRATDATTPRTLVRIRKSGFLHTLQN